MAAFEYIECLLFEQDLLVGREIARQHGFGLIRDNSNFLRERFGNILRARSPFDAVRWKCFELWIVFRVIATMGNQKHPTLARNVSKPPNVGQQSFSTWNVQLAAREHEVSLRIDFPEDEIAG